MTDGVHASVAAIQSMEAAVARFARAMIERLPDVERELRQTIEALEELEQELRRKEAEEELARVQRRLQCLEEIGAAYKSHARKVEHLSTDHAVRAKEFLCRAADDLRAYLALNRGESSATVGTNDASAASRSSVSATDAMRETIRGANYVTSERLEGGVNESWKLMNGISVIFKPGSRECKRALRPGIRPGTQYRREKAASVIDELLGLGLVPPTEIITRPDCHGIGSAQVLRDHFETARSCYERGVIGDNLFEKLTHRQRHDWQLLDELLGSMDRHTRNWLLRRHSDSDFDLALIDNGLCLSESGHTGLRAKPASQENLDDVNRARLERFLAMEEHWRPKLRNFVGDSAIDHMCRRGRLILSRGRYE